MDNWENTFKNWLNAVEGEFESLYKQINQDWQKNNQEWEKKINELTEEVEEILTTELTQFLAEIDDLFTEIVELFIDEESQEDIFYDDDFYDELNSLFDNDNIKPNPQIHPACQGCRNYHGRSYNGNLLVCGMHPYGWHGDTCPDWED